MNAQTARYVFALLCALGIVAIFGGLLLEIGRMRREPGAISTRQFRWRMFAAFLWLLILASLAYATLYQWPQGPGDQLTARRFGAIVSGAMLLLVLALALLAIDVWQTGKQRKRHERQFEHDVNDLARLEIEKARQRKDEE